MAEELSIDRLWRCGVGHIVEIDSGVPPYDMGLCPHCAALSDIRRRAEQAEAELQKIREAWSESWDCSADPGHKIMDAALGLSWDA